MSLSNLLEMNDDELIEIVNEEFELLAKQAALYSIINDIMDQFEEVQYRRKEIEWQLELLRMENASLRKSIQKLSK